MQQAFVGYIIEVESYTEARAVVLALAASVLRYGALVLVDDVQGGRKYLALVLDVSEHSIAPAIDTQRLQQLSQQLQGKGFQNAQKLLQLLLSPTQSLIRWHGVRELKLRLLGELTQTSSGWALALPSQPPRPTSLVLEPDPGLVQQLLSGGLGGRAIYLGVLAYNPSVKVYLNPDKLTMHVAVLGQTGSGKTETVKRLVAEYMWRKEEFSSSGGVAVFDVAGEYTGYPYSANVTPLLDAAVEPGRFTGLKAAWLRSARKTILVPYDLSSIGFRVQAEQRYIREMAGLIVYLEARYGLRVDGLVYMRHGVYRVEAGSSRPSITRLSRAEAARALAQSPFLVVAAPLPQVLSTEEIYELSHTTSSAFLDVIETLADIAGILEYGYVAEVKGLSDLIEILRIHNQPNTIAAAFENAASVFIQTAKRKPVKDAELEACKTLREKLKPSFVDCRALTGFAAYSMAGEALERLHHTAVANTPLAQHLEIVASYIPGTAYTSEETGTWEILAAALEHDKLLKQQQRLPRQLGKPLYNVLEERITRMKSVLDNEAPSTVRSIIRGLRRVARHVSPYLDAAHYQLLVERRVTEGFTIVHLAPPSRGNTDYAVARLLDAVFHASVRNYSPERKTLIVVEEAHNLAPAGEDRASKRVLLRAAREGRKWGLSLVLVSQRPGFIDPNVLSQTATLIALRITNPDDIAGLRRGAESASLEFIDRLPDLEQGQAVVAGVAVPERRIPLLVRIERIAPRP